MDNFYCEYCGEQFSSMVKLTTGECQKHPSGSYKGKHKLYEGGVKSKYMCKYCGESYPSIKAMVLRECQRHPLGAYQGRHAPAL